MPRQALGGDSAVRALPKMPVQPVDVAGRSASGAPRSPAGPRLAGHPPAAHRDAADDRHGFIDLAFAIWLSRQLRRQRVSQREIARRSGLCHSTISRILLGQREPSWETVQRLALVVGFPPPNVMLGRFGVMSRADADDGGWDAPGGRGDSGRRRS